MATKLHKMRWGGPKYTNPILRHGVLSDITGQLAELLRTHVPFVEGVRVAAVDAPSNAAKFVLLSIHEGLARGEPLHAAMDRLPNFFPRHYIDMVRVGEDTGRLEECFGELEGELADAAVFRNEFLSVVTYVAVAAPMILLMGAGLMMFVVPQFATIFSEVGAPLAPRMQALMAVGEFVTGYPGGIAVLAIALLVLLRWRIGPRRAMELRRKLFAPLLAMPGVRAAVAKSNLGQAAGVLQRMLRVGIPLPRALRSVSELDLLPAYANSFKRIAGRVEAGDSFTEAAHAEARHITPSFLMMIAVGEKSGLLPDALKRIADVYREDTKRFVGILVGFLEPVLILLMGGMVYFILTGIFFTVFELSQIPV